MSHTISYGKLPTRPVEPPPRNMAPQDFQTVEACATIQNVIVAVIEDDERTRRALVFQIATAGVEVEPYACAEEFLNAATAKDFDCILVDINLPRMNGLELQEELNRTIPYASIVFITGHGDLPLGMHAMRKGAVDFLEKPIDDQILFSSIARGTHRSRTRRAEHYQHIELEKRHGYLTPREREVFDLITTGFLNKQVGAELGTTERTVKAHREKVMSKMAAGSLADLVRMADVLQIHPARAQAALPNWQSKLAEPSRNAPAGSLTPPAMLRGSAWPPHRLVKAR
jgi:two-component system, LuxR family, response regulator FixJ